MPAVAEPLIVWILSGSALVEEREFGEAWTGRTVTAGEFFLTTSPTPYELRWKVTGRDPFITSHIYISLPTFARALKDVLGPEAKVPALREVFGERDDTLSALLDQLRLELTARPSASPLFVQGIAQSLAVHLVRTYPDPHGSDLTRRGELPAFTLRKIAARLQAHLDQDFQLAQLADEAGMSESHFSRLFKRTTGFSPSQYFIRLRIARARQLLRETSMSMIEVSLEVGYSSPSHFAQIFRREAGVSPTDYRGRF